MITRTSKTVIQSYAHKYASLYLIDPLWVQAIIEVESAGISKAWRYESSYQYLYEVERCARNAQCTLATEIAAQKFSYGLGQIMGALARQQGLDGPMGQLFDEETNIKHMCIYLKFLKSKASTTDDIFAGY